MWACADVPANPTVVISPLVADRSYVLSAHFDWQPGNEGIIFALGDRFCGLVLFVENDALHCIYQQWHNPKTLTRSVSQFPCPSSR